MNNISIIFLILIIKSIALKYNNDSYLINLILIFNFSYYYSSNYKVSLAISLLHLLLTTFIKYINHKKAKIVNSIIFIFIVYYIQNIITFITPFIEIIIFSCISYILFSICEWSIHKNIMHCNKKSLFFNMISIFDTNKVIEETCTHHIEHHIDVKPDMNLFKVPRKDSLFMGWKISKYIFLFVLLSLIISKYISGINTSYTKIIILGIIFTIFWSYLWNKIHPLMHNYKGEYSIKEGPYENILDFNFLNNIFYKNHSNHHLQKGNTKGNYNIIVIGADEWFGTNVIKVDNREYCKNPAVAHEAICKK